MLTFLSEGHVLLSEGHVSCFVGRLDAGEDIEALGSRLMDSALASNNSESHNLLNLEVPRRV